MAVFCFPNKCTGEDISLGMDFGKRLHGERIIGVTSDMVCTEGCDVGPEAMLYGPPIIDGAKVSQQIIGGIPGNTYELTFEAETSGNRLLLLRGRFSVTA